MKRRAWCAAEKNTAGGVAGCPLNAGVWGWAPPPAGLGRAQERRGGPPEAESGDRKKARVTEATRAKLPTRREAAGENLLTGSPGGKCDVMQPLALLD